MWYGHSFSLWPLFLPQPPPHQAEWEHTGWPALSPSPSPAVLWGACHAAAAAVLCPCSRPCTRLLENQPAWVLPQHPLADRPSPVPCLHHSGQTPGRIRIRWEATLAQQCGSARTSCAGPVPWRACRENDMRPGTVGVQLHSHRKQVLPWSTGRVGQVSPAGGQGEPGAGCGSMGNSLGRMQPRPPETTQGARGKVPEAFVGGRWSTKHKDCGLERTAQLPAFRTSLHQTAFGNDTYPAPFCSRATCPVDTAVPPRAWTHHAHCLPAGVAPLP